jgi:hypothetical protein
MLQVRVGGVYLGTATTNIVCSNGLYTTDNSPSMKFNGTSWSSIGRPNAIFRAGQVTGSTTAASSGIIANGWDLTYYIYGNEQFYG